MLSSVAMSTHWWSVARPEVAEAEAEAWWSVAVEAEARQSEAEAVEAEADKADQSPMSDMPLLSPSS